MDGLQVALPIVGVLAAAAVTFYAVSFSELKEKSFRDLEESEYEDGVYRPSPSSRERRARRQANKNNKK
ncbi:uncharacterized protein HKW66_Vig0136820 [Vigna angularis]|uniref:Transmembrane protein n=1 Tax=Phaseolus angularis TaxID=3914 RepID=A0A8T0KGJ5_PHAAN|nr:uncharacterized protein LOC108340041 [Vigna angularis]KAG2398082.1 uncharacterized protein HKW66_Vig0136820 [Vigna angularis]